MQPVSTKFDLDSSSTSGDETHEWAGVLRVYVQFTHFINP